MLNHGRAVAIGIGLGLSVILIGFGLVSTGDTVAGCAVGFGGALMLAGAIEGWRRGPDDR
jgi:hypothetical protein